MPRLGAQIRLVIALLIAAVSGGASAQSGLQPNAPWAKFHGNNLNSGIGIGGSSNGVIRWTFEASNDIAVAPVVAADGTIYFGSNDGTFYALNPDGSLKWHFDTQDHKLNLTRR